MDEINYTLLETARQLRRKTQKEVAEDTGVPQSSLSKAEHGLTGLPWDAFLRLCGYYDLPETFFHQKDSASPVGHLYYRRRLKITDRVIDSFVAKVKIHKPIIDTIMSAVEIPEYTLQSLILNEDSSPKEIADQTRYKLGIYSGAAPNLPMLLENNGIIIMDFDFGTDRIDGLTTVTDSGRKVIFINYGKPDDRIRFSLAHELGHLVMHIENPPASSEDAERQADEFASEFLMPADEIRPMLTDLRPQTLAMLKRRWRVSMHALVRRARDLGTIDQKQYRNLQILFSKNGYTKNEPVALPEERPTLWKETLRLYREELGYSDEELMRVMNINRGDFRSWFKPETRPRVIDIRPFVN